MPTYNYKCKECDHKFEALHGMSEPPPPCPKCCADKSEKLISKSTFILKGKGWFNTGGY